MNSEEISVFDLLFENVQAYENLAEAYIKYWISADLTVCVYNPCCEPCQILDGIGEEKHLIQIYYGMLPMTRTCIVDAAVVLLLKCWGNLAFKKISQLSPFAICYHFYINCCFTEKHDANNLQTKFADLLISLDVTYCLTNEVDIKYLGYNLRGYKKSLQLKCECGKLKKSVVQIINEERQSSEKGTLFAGACDEIYSSEDSNDKKKEGVNSDYRLKLVKSFLSQYDSELYESEKNGNQPPNVNFLKHYHNCDVCDSMCLAQFYNVFDMWQDAYMKTFRELKGANVTTCITKTFETIGHAVKLEELIQHSKNAICMYNVRRFIGFFRVFSDMSKVKDKYIMKHITESFLKYREDLICCDLLFAIWIETIVIQKLRIYNEKIGAWVNNVYHSHDFWYL